MTPLDEWREFWHRGVLMQMYRGFRCMMMQGVVNIDDTLGNAYLLLVF